MSYAVCFRNMLIMKHLHPLFVPIPSSRFYILTLLWFCALILSCDYIFLSDWQWVTYKFLSHLLRFWGTLCPQQQEQRPDVVEETRFWTSYLSILPQSKRRTWRSDLKSLQITYSGKIDEEIKSGMETSATKDAKNRNRRNCILVYMAPNLWPMEDG